MQNSKIGVELHKVMLGWRPLAPMALAPAPAAKRQVWKLPASSRVLPQGLGTYSFPKPNTIFSQFFSLLMSSLNVTSFKKPSLTMPSNTISYLLALCLLFVSWDLLLTTVILFPCVLSPECESFVLPLYSSTSPEQCLWANWKKIALTIICQKCVIINLQIYNYKMRNTARVVQCTTCAS